MNHFDNKDNMILDIQLDPVRDGLKAEYPEEDDRQAEKAYYPVIGTNGEIRMTTRREAQKIMNDLGDDAEYLYLGNNGYVLIYNGTRKFDSEGDSYYAGSVLALRKDEKKLMPLTIHEIHRVLDQMTSRLAMFIVGDVSFSALELD